MREEHVLVEKHDGALQSDESTNLVSHEEGGDEDELHGEEMALIPRHVAADQVHRPTWCSKRAVRSPRR